MNKQKQHEQEIVKNDLVSYLEEKLDRVKPYWSQITLFILLAILAATAVVYFGQQAKSLEAEKSQRLSVALSNYRFSMDSSYLAQTADLFPNDPAGMWALLYAADAEMRSGLSDFSTDKKAGFDKVSKAINYYRRIVDSSAPKSTTLQQRSLFGLAYALESNGEFEEAAKLYQVLVDLGPDSPFEEDARRGLVRSTDSNFVALYDQFREFEPDPADAPGDRLPRRPNIYFPDDVQQPDSGGGAFEEGQ